MAEDYLNVALKLSCSTLCESEGFDGCTKSALDLLLWLFGQQISGIGRSVLDCCGGTLPSSCEGMGDVFRKIGLSVMELEKYFRKNKEISFPFSLPDVGGGYSRLAPVIRSDIKADLLKKVVAVAQAKEEGSCSERKLTYVSMDESGHIIQQCQGKLPESKHPVKTFDFCEVPNVNSLESRMLEVVQKYKLRRLNRSGEKRKQLCRKDMQRRILKRDVNAKPRIVLKLKIPRTTPPPRRIKNARNICQKRNITRKLKDNLEVTPDAIPIENNIISDGPLGISLDALPPPPPEFQFWHKPVLVPGLIPLYNPALAPPMFSLPTPFISKLVTPPAPIDRENMEESEPRKECLSQLPPRHRPTSLKSLLGSLKIKAKFGGDVALKRIDAPCTDILAPYFSSKAPVQSSRNEKSILDTIWKVSVRTEDSITPKDNSETNDVPARIPKLILKRQRSNEHLPTQGKTEADEESVVCEKFKSLNLQPSSEEWLCSECQLSYVSQMVACDKCGHWFHFTCAELFLSVVEAEPWYCRRCSGRKPSVEL